jgi:hypothetical protein
MRALGSILVIASLVLGSFAVATAYHVSLRGPNLRNVIGLHLASDAGVRLDASGSPVLDEQGRRVPIVRARDEQGEPTIITNEMLNELGAGTASAPVIRVMEFRWSLWGRAWWFAASVVGLVAGAALLRADQRARRQAAAAGRAAGGAGRARDAFEHVRAAVHSLRDELPSSPETVRLEVLLERIGQLQRTDLRDFVDAREELGHLVGARRCAELMDHFAAMERQLNRAWSAAADGVWEEARASLERAAQRFPDLESLLPEAGKG